MTQKQICHSKKIHFLRIPEFEDDDFGGRPRGLFAGWTIASSEGRFRGNPWATSVGFWTFWYSKALRARAGRPRFLFAPMSRFLATSGIVRSLRRDARPIRCLQMQFFWNAGHEHFPSLQFSELAPTSMCQREKKMLWYLTQMTQTRLTSINQCIFWLKYY